MEEDIWTIEINQDEDFTNVCSYHVDTLARTSARNLKIACERINTNRWALVGIAISHEEAVQKMQRVIMELCEMHGKKPKNMNDVLHITRKFINEWSKK